VGAQAASSMREAKGEQLQGKTDITVLKEHRRKMGQVMEYMKSMQDASGRCMTDANVEGSAQTMESRLGSTRNKVRSEAAALERATRKIESQRLMESALAKLGPHFS